MTWKLFRPRFYEYAIPQITDYFIINTAIINDRLRHENRHSTQVGVARLPQTRPSTDRHNKLHRRGAGKAGGFSINRVKPATARARNLHSFAGQHCLVWKNYKHSDAKAGDRHAGQGRQGCAACVWNKHLHGCKKVSLASTMFAREENRRHITVIQKECAECRFGASANTIANAIFI